VAEFTVGAFNYKSKRLSGLDQFDVLRVMLPVFATFGEAGRAKEGGGDVISAAMPIAKAIAGMSRDDSRFVLQSCLATVQREQPGGTGWAPIWNVPANAPMFSDIDDMAIMLQIAVQVLQDNFARFFPAALLASSGGATP